MFIVYARVDERNRVLELNSSAFLHSTEGWIAIDSGDGDKYHHAQGNYVKGPVRDVNAIPLYELSGGKIKQRKQADIDADLAAIPKPKPSMDARRWETLITELEKGSALTEIAKALRALEQEG